MPEDDDDVRTGSGRQRWDRDRKLAMETALNYAKGLGLSIKWLDARHFLLLWEVMQTFPITHRRFFEDWLQVTGTFTSISKDRWRLSIGNISICSTVHQHILAHLIEAKHLGKTDTIEILIIIIISISMVSLLPRCYASFKWATMCWCTVQHSRYSSTIFIYLWKCSEKFP